MSDKFKGVADYERNRREPKTRPTGPPKRIEYILDRTMTKRPAIYRKENRQECGVLLTPIMYLQRAKNAPEEDFERIINILTNTKI
jgi:hypothetical protein